MSDDLPRASEQLRFITKSTRRLPLDAKFHRRLRLRANPSRPCPRDPLSAMPTGEAAGPRSARRPPWTAGAPALCDPGEIPRDFRERLLVLEPHREADGVGRVLRQGDPGEGPHLHGEGVLLLGDVADSG